MQSFLVLDLARVQHAERLGAARQPCQGADGDRPGRRWPRVSRSTVAGLAAAAVLIVQTALVDRRMPLR